MIQFISLQNSTVYIVIFETLVWPTITNIWLRDFCQKLVTNTYWEVSFSNFNTTCVHYLQISETMSKIWNANFLQLIILICDTRNDQFQIQFKNQVTTSKEKGRLHSWNLPTGNTKNSGQLYTDEQRKKLKTMTKVEKRAITCTKCGFFFHSADQCTNTKMIQFRFNSLDRDLWAPTFFSIWIRRVVAYAFTKRKRC